MRHSVCLLAFVAFSACAEAPSGIDTTNRLAPPIPRVEASSRVIAGEGGVPVLEVSAVLRNSTPVHFKVATGAGCPLFVRLYSAPTGEYSGSVDGSMACPTSSLILDLGPGDSAVLTRTIRGDSLAMYAPGNYGINIAVTTNAFLIGTGAGAVRLPLSNVP